MEAREVSSIKPQLDSRGIKLYAIMLESLGLKEFQEYFDGEIFIDEKRKFYGPVERKMGLLGMLRLSTYLSVYKAKQDVDGNLEGEGRILGGAFVIGPGDQGIVLEDRNADFGATVNVASLLEASERVNKDSKL